MAIKKIKLLKAMSTAKTAFIIFLSFFVLGLTFYSFSNNDWVGLAVLGLFLVVGFAVNDKFIMDKLKAFEQSKLYKVGVYLVAPIAFVCLLIWFFTDTTFTKMSAVEGVAFFLMAGIWGVLFGTILIATSWPLAALYLVFVLIKSMFFI